MLYAPKMKLNLCPTHLRLNPSLNRFGGAYVLKRMLPMPEPKPRPDTPKPTPKLDDWYGDRDVSSGVVWSGVVLWCDVSDVWSLVLWWSGVVSLVEWSGVSGALFSGPLVSSPLSSIMRKHRALQCSVCAWRLLSAETRERRDS
jgi:hypothetical protein